MNKTQKSDKTNTILSVMIVLFLLSILIYFVYAGWTNMRNNGYSSCIASVAGEIHRNKSKLPIEIKSEWTILSTIETDEILSKIELYDCANTSNSSIDLWNNKIQIAARKFNNEIEIIVWSKGSDGISYTDDDIVAPFGKTPPK